MLCLHAFGKPQAPSALEGLAMEAADICSGLPLTLSVVGRHLILHRDRQAWEGALCLLRQAEELDGRANGSTFARMRVSYDYLAQNLQNMLIEIASMLVGRPTSTAIHAWDAGGLRLENLRSLCLISVEDGMLGMHDLVRDMLLSVAAGGRHASWYAREPQAADIRDPTILQVCCFQPCDTNLNGMAVQHRR